MCNISTDFYSKSGYRDLLFHEQEHQFDLLQVSQLLKKCRLKFISICHTPDVVRSLSDSIYVPQTLEEWHKYEVSNPRTFVGMYHLLIQKEY